MQMRCTMPFRVPSAAAMGQEWPQLVQAAAWAQKGPKRGDFGGEKRPFGGKTGPGGQRKRLWGSTGPSWGGVGQDGGKGVVLQGQQQLWGRMWGRALLCDGLVAFWGKTWRFWGADGAVGGQRGRVWGQCGGFGGVVGWGNSWHFWGPLFWGNSWCFGAAMLASGVFGAPGCVAASLDASGAPQPCRLPALPQINANCANCMLIVCKRGRVSAHPSCLFWWGTQWWLWVVESVVWPM